MSLLFMPFFFFLFLQINAFFLVNIIRVLVTKLRAHNTLEMDQARKAVKATAVLFPLLGLTNALSIMKAPGQSAEAVYRITYAILQSSQGAFVAVIYCFLNSEVRAAIKKKWYRHRLRSLGSSRTPRSSRTSSVLLSTDVNIFFKQTFYYYRCFKLNL